MENEFKTSKSRPLPAVEHQPKTSFLEMRLNIGDLNPILTDKNELRVSIPTVAGYVIEPMMQIHLEDQLGRDHYKLLDRKLRNMINMALLAHLLSERMEEL